MKFLFELSCFCVIGISGAVGVKAVQAMQSVAQRDTVQNPVSHSSSFAIRKLPDVLSTVSTRPIPKVSQGKPEMPPPGKGKPKHDQRRTQRSIAQTKTPVVRVLVASDSEMLAIATSTPGTLINAQGQRVAEMQSGMGYTITSNQQGIQVGSTIVPEPFWIVPEDEGLVFVNGRWYQGHLLVTFDGDSLLAVNYINLEQYLWSVVGAEMSASWNMQALKAQAIAARSYALAHMERPASKWFDLGDDERWQVYKGVESVSDRTAMAVAFTTSQVLVADGKVVEALYASSDEVSVEAHSGIGMSQLGAKKLADDGKDYTSILNWYYPTAGLARLEVN